MIELVATEWSMLWTFPGLVAVGSVVIGSAILRGFTGFGFGLAAVPLLGFMLGPAPAVVVAVGLQFLGGVTDTVRARRISHWPSLRWLMAGAVVGSPIGTLALAGLSDGAARLLISLVCLSAVILIAQGRSFRSHPTPITISLVGLVAGVFNGLAAMPGPPVVAYYMAAMMEPVVSRASLVTFFTATAALALVSSFLAGLWTWDESLLVLASFPLMLIGTAMGQALFRRAGSHHRTASLTILAAISIVSGAQGIATLLEPQGSDTAIPLGHAVKPFHR